MVELVPTTSSIDVTIDDALTQTPHFDAHAPIGEAHSIGIGEVAPIADALRTVCVFHEVKTLGNLGKLSASQVFSVLADCPYAIAVVNLANTLLEEHKLPRMRP